MRALLSQWRVTVFGLLSWAIPFAASIPFFTPSGELLVPQPLFKSSMVLIGSTVGIILLIRTFKHLRPSLGAGLAIGVYWLAINLVLDVLVLLPMSGQSPLDYFYDIGLRYFVLPVMAAGLAYMGRTTA